MVYPWKAFHRMFIEVNNRPRSIVQGEEFKKFFDNVEIKYFNTKINATELVNVLATSFEEDEQKKAAQELAVAANQWLPEYPIAEKRLILFYNKEHFVWPDPKANYDAWLNAGGGHLEALAFMITHGMVVPNPKYWGVTVTVPTTTTVTKTTTTATTVTTAQTIVKTTTVSGTVTVSKTIITTQYKTTTVPTTVTTTQVQTTTVTQTTTNWGIAGGLLIIGLIIGIIIGWAAKRK